MPPSGARLGLYTPLRLFLFGLGFAVFFLLLWWKNSLVAPTADIAVVRALRGVTSADAEVVISNRYRLSGRDGRSDTLDLACGVAAGQPFAAEVRRKAGSRRGYRRDTAATTYSIDAVALQGAADPSLRDAGLLADCQRLSR